MKTTDLKTYEGKTIKKIIVKKIKVKNINADVEETIIKFTDGSTLSVDSVLTTFW